MRRRMTRRGGRRRPMRRGGRRRMMKTRRRGTRALRIGYRM